MPLALLLTGSLAAQSWTQASPANNPGNLRDAAAAYHLATGTTVVFGGFPALSATWLYDGNDWSAASPATVPPGRRNTAMAHDLGRSRTVMFGGVGASALADTWEWDGNDWVARMPAASPAARQGHVMAYDAGRGVTVLFGGTADPNRPGNFTDTWEWDGINWTRVATANAPSESVDASMCYDLVRGRIVLTGGTSLFGAPDQKTWEYDGTDWTDVTATVGLGPTSTPGLGVSNAKMVYDPARQVAVLYGGRTPNGTFSTETWEYDGTSWTLAATGTPSSRTRFVMAMDSGRGVAVLYGGLTGNFQTWFQETWEYGSAASYRLFGSGCAGSAGIPQLAPQAGAVPRIGSAFTLQLTNLPPGGGLAYMVLGLSNTTWNGQPLPLDLTGFGLAGCNAWLSVDSGVLVPNVAGTATWTITVPSIPGFTFYNQGVSLDAAAPHAFPGAVSNAGEGVIG